MQPGYYFKCRVRLWVGRNIWNTLSVTWKWKLVPPKGIGTKKTCWRTREVRLAKHVVYIENICYKSLKNFIFNFLCDPWLLQAMCAFSTQRHSNLYVLQLNFITRFIELPSCLTFFCQDEMYPPKTPPRDVILGPRIPSPHDVSLWRGFPHISPVRGFPTDVIPLTSPRTPSCCHHEVHPTHALHAQLVPSFGPPTCTSLTTLSYLWHHHFSNFYWRTSQLNKFNRWADLVNLEPILLLWIFS